MADAIKGGKKIYRKNAPVGDTGNLKRYGLSADKPIVKGNIAIAKFHLNAVDKSKFVYGDEAKYPLFVERGTEGPIKPSGERGNFLKLRNKKTNFIFTKKKQVKGQKAQYFYKRSVESVGRNFADAVARQRLKAKIVAAIAAASK